MLVLIICQQKPTKQLTNQESYETIKIASNQTREEVANNLGKQDLALPVPVIVSVALLDREEAHVVLPAPARRPHGHLVGPP